MTSFSSQNKTSSSSLGQDDQMIWKEWEISQDREHYSIMSMNDKIVILNGYKTVNQTRRRQNTDITILDPKTQTLKRIPPTGAFDELCWASASACYWKDNKIMIFGGTDLNNYIPKSTIGMITLKDLDSENPTAYWQLVNTANKLEREFDFAHIYMYKDKMYVVGKPARSYESPQDVWCLDLATFEWKQQEITGDLPKITSNFSASQNKIHTLYWMEPDFCIYEYDLDNFTCRAYKCPGPRSCEAYVICSQIENQQAYVLVQNEFAKPTTHPKNELWSFDFGLQKWKQIEVINGCPSLNERGYMLLCDNQLVVYGGWEDEANPTLQRCWSLPIGSQKVSYVSTQSMDLTKLQRTMKQFLKEAPYSDISFEVESQVIPAHKWWLTKKSKYFINMFSSGMIKAQASKITIIDMTATAFKAFLEFLYSDHVELNESLALELLQQADKYSVADLKTVCETSLAANITPENFVKIGKIAELVEAVSLRQAVVNYTGRNIKKLKERKDFEEISDSLLRDSIVKFIVN